MQRIQLVLGLPEWMKVPEQRVIDETEAMEGYESYLSLFQDGEMQFLTRYRGDPEVWAEALDEMDHVLEYEIIPVTDDEFYSFSRTRREGTEEALKSLLDDAGAFLDHPIEYPVDDGKVRLAVVGEQDALREVIDGFHDDIAVTIERIKEVGTDGADRSSPRASARPSPRRMSWGTTRFRARGASPTSLSASIAPRERPRTTSGRRSPRSSAGWSTTDRNGTARMSTTSPYSLGADACSLR
jgi:hypothetical protein